MIVLHGIAGLAESVSEYTLSLDNKNYEIVPGEDSLHDNIVLEDYNSSIKTDGTAVGEGATIKIKIGTSNIDDIKIKSGFCKGEKNTLLPSDDSTGLTKEEYLSEVSAFINSGRVDFSMSSVGYESPKDGPVFTSWLSDKPESGFELDSDEETNEINIRLYKESEDNFVLEYDTKTVVEAQDDCDWYIATSIELKIDIITKAGAIVKDEEVSYHHDDAPIASCVNIEGGKYLTFDSEIAIVGGWWESSDIAVRTRQIAKSGISTRDSMFRYIIFGAIAPKVFSTNIRNMVFTASRADTLYSLDKVFTNNLYECPNLNELTIVSSAPEISGEATIIPDEATGTISIDTSDVSTSLGEMHIEISDPSSMNSCKFQIKAGAAPTANFIVAGVDSRILYNQITGQGITSITSANVDNGLIGFHLFVNGLQEYLVDDTWDPVHAVLGLMSMGITCALTGNMLEFVFYLYYESVKSILWDSERRIVMREITRTQEHYLSSMAQAQQGLDASTRKKVARQWLEMIDARYMKMSGPTIHRTFFIKIACTHVPVDMSTSIPYTLGLPMYGVPMGEGILDAVNTPDHIMTDDVYSMMKKNAHFSMYRTRMDWAMSLGGSLGEFATYWAWGGTLVVISTGGVHQELYAAEDPAYGINSAEHETTGGPVVSDVAISGEIGDSWDEFVATRGPVSRFTYWNGQPKRDGIDAEDAISEWADDAVPVMRGMVNSVIIDTDNNTVTINGSDTRDAIIYRPNPSVILAFEKPQ